MSQNSSTVSIGSPLSAAQRALLERRLRGAPPRQYPIPRRPPDGPAPLSSGQRRLWALDRLLDNAAPYHVVQVLRIRGGVAGDVLARCVQAVVHRHEILRTTFDVVDDQPVQIVSSRPAIDWGEVDFEHLGPSSAAEKALSTALANAMKPFDLQRGPLLRMMVIRIEPSQHLVLLALHHIVADERSLEIFWQEIASCYDAMTRDRSPLLPDLTVQYADFARWQRDRHGSDASQSQLRYWLAELEGAPEVCTFPTDHPRPARLSMRGRQARARLPDSLSRGLRAYAKDLQTTPFAVWLAGFLALLFRFSGQTDIVVGIPFANRGHPSLEPLIGFFLNTLVIRVDFSPRPSFRELVQTVHWKLMHGFDHGDCPFDTLAERVPHRRALSHNPLFQVMFVFEQAQAPARLAPGLDIEPVAVDTGGSKFDLTCFVRERETGVDVALEYSTDLYAAPSVERLMTHWQTLLSSAVASPAAPVARLRLLVPGQRRELLADWNTAATDRAEDTNVLDLFRKRVEETPEAPAVSSRERTLTYRELDQCAARLAVRLNRHGLRPGDRVAVCAERSVDLIIGILAVLGAGGAYVPIDPGNPAARRRFLLEDSGASIVIAQRRLLEHFREFAGAIIALDGRELAGSEGAKTALSFSVPSTSPAYLIYTSGSTGRPKGVVVTHANLAHSTLARFRYYGPTKVRFLLLSSFAFDSSVAGIFWSLCGGGTLILPETRAEQDLARLSALISASGATHTLCLPSLYALLLEHADAGRLASLQTVIVAGEACPPRLVHRHHTLRPGAGLYNEYGPTEATVWCAVHRTRPEDARASVPIGRPVPNSRLYVLDEEREPVPIGVPGELYVGGNGVAAGYWNQPELCARSFVPDPFAEAPGQRMYRTGDRVRLRSDSTLEFLGRSDHQIKIRGHRIELEEVERTLAGSAQVEELAVAATNGDDTGAASPPTRLTAYVVPRVGFEASDLLRRSREQLPSYMVPTEIVLLDALPRTATGKLDRRTLARSRPLEHPPRCAEDVAPTDTQRMLASIWMNLLGVRAVGPDDNFFEIGGDSMLSILLVSKAREAGMAISPTQLFVSFWLTL